MPSMQKRNREHRTKGFFEWKHRYGNRDVLNVKSVHVLININDTCCHLDTFEIFIELTRAQYHLF